MNLTRIYYHDYIQVAGCAGFISANTLKFLQVSLTNLCFVYSHVYYFRMLMALFFCGHRVCSPFKYFNCAELNNDLTLKKI
jgi:hypothetical protein